MKERGHVGQLSILDDGRSLVAHATDLCWSVLRLQGMVQYKLYKHEDLCLDP